MKTSVMWTWCSFRVLIGPITAQILKMFLIQCPISPALQLWPSPLHNHPPISPNYTDWSNEATVCKSQQLHFYGDISNTIGVIVTDLCYEAFRDDSFGVLMTFDHASITGEFCFVFSFFFHLPEAKHIFQSFSPSLIQFFFSYSLPPFTSSFL